MKGLKILIALLLLLQLFSMGAAAESPGTGNTSSTGDLYSEQYEASGAGDLNNALPQGTVDILNNLGLSPEDPTWVAKLSPKTIFTLIWEFLRDGGKTPFVTAGALVAVMLLAAALNGFMTNDGIGLQFSNIVVIASAAVMILPLFEVLRGSAGAIKGCGVFMLSFVPIYAAIAISSGQVATAGGFTTIMLGVSELVVQLASFVYLPLTGAYLALNVSAAVSPISGISGLADSIKKVATWVMTITLAVFLGVLGFQTTVSAAADNVAIRTTKFIVTGAVPVVGSAIGESLTTVKSCLTLLRSSVGIYGVVAIVMMMLPVIAELLMWRLSLILCITVSQVLELPKMTAFLRAIDAALAVFVGIMIFISILFIISLTMVIMAGGAG